MFMKRSKKFGLKFLELTSKKQSFNLKRRKERLSNSERRELCRMLLGSTNLEINYRERLEPEQELQMIYIVLLTSIRLESI